MSSALSPVSRMAATVRSAWRRPARTLGDCPGSEGLPAGGGQSGSCKETAMCRRADHAGVSATAHIGRGVLFRSSPKAHHRSGQVAWGSGVPDPGCLGGGRANPGIGRGAPRRGWVPASSSQGTPVLPTAPRRPISPCRTSPRGCSAFLPRALPSRKNAPPRALPTKVASISPRHLSGFVTYSSL
jgi:hypothetical protein